MGVSNNQTVSYYLEKKLNEITNGFSLEGNDYSNDKMDKQSTREIKNVKQMFKDMGYT